ncbi:MAG: MarR family transcriptional regulator [Opitutaceae bacterium]
MKNLVYEIIATAGAIEAAGIRILKPFSLTPMSYNILNLLDGPPLSQRQLGDKLIVVASSVTFQVRQLQQRGLLKRRRQDRRTWLVSLTPEGEARLRSATFAMDELLARFRVDPQALIVTHDTLGNLKQQIANADRPALSS